MPLVKEIYENSKNLSVLLVEDDVELLKQISSVLSHLFKEVDSEQDGEAGLKRYEEKLEKSSKAYDLVISDINMPIMNGIEMVEHICEITPRQPIIITSAHSDYEYLIKLINIGVNGFIMKPIDYIAMNKILLKTVSAINNESLVKKHFKKIENLNKVLSIQSEQLKITNEELRDKNIALEESKHIFETLNASQKIKIQNSLDNIDTLYNTNKSINNPILSEISNNCSNQLDDINSTIDELSLKYHKTDHSIQLLKKLSHAIDHCVDLLDDSDSYLSLRESLNNLSSTVSEHPKVTTNEDLHKVFDMLESFFFIYSKWINMLKDIDETQIKNFTISIEDEIKKIIEIWNTKS